MRSTAPLIKIATIRKVRRPRGFSLIAITAMILISSLWVSAMMAMILPTFERMNLLAASGVLRSAAETGLDLVIADLCNAPNAPSGPIAFDSNGKTGSQYDAPFAGSQRTDISNAVDTLLNKPGVSVWVTVYNETPAPVTAPTGYSLPPGYPTPSYATPSNSVRVGTNSFLYDPLIDEQLIQNWGTPSALQNPYRRIEATATYGIASMTIRVILQPTFGNSQVSAMPPMLKGFAAFGNSGVYPIGLVTTDSYGTPSPAVSGTMDPTQLTKYQNPSNGNWLLYANVGSNASVTEINGVPNRGVTYGGSKFEFPTMTPTQIATAQAAYTNALNAGDPQGPKVTQPWTQVYDNVFSNNVPPGFWPRGPAPVPSTPLPSYDNVFGFSGSNAGTPVDSTSNSGQYANLTGPSDTPINSGVTAPYPKITMPPVSSSPVGSPALGDINLTGSQTLIFQDNAPMVTPDWTQSTIVLPTNQSYSITSLTLSNNASIVVQGTQQTNLYIEGNTPATALFTDVNTSITNGTNGTSAPNNFSILAAGSENMSITGSIRADIYAPKSTIVVGTGDLGYVIPATNFWGTVVGDTVYLYGGAYDQGQTGGVNMHFSAANAMTNGQLANAPPPTLAVSGFRIVTWEELTPQPLANANAPYVVGPSSYKLLP